MVVSSLDCSCCNDCTKAYWMQDGFTPSNGVSAPTFSSFRRQLKPFLFQQSYPDIVLYKLHIWHYSAAVFKLVSADPRTEGGPRRVPRVSARGFTKIVIVCTVYVKNNWQTVQRKTSTSITLTLLAIHCNLYVTDEVDTFVKIGVHKNLGILYM